MLLRRCRDLFKMMVLFPLNVVPKVGLLGPLVFLFFVFWGLSIIKPSSLFSGSKSVDTTPYRSLFWFSHWQWPLSLMCILLDHYIYALFLFYFLKTVHALCKLFLILILVMHFLLTPKDCLPFPPPPPSTSPRVWPTSQPAQVPQCTALWVWPILPALGGSGYTLRNECSSLSPLGSWEMWLSGRTVPDT